MQLSPYNEAYDNWLKEKIDTENFTTEQTAKYQIWVKAVSNDNLTLDSAFGKPQGSIPLARIDRDPETLEGGAVEG